jgi:tetratricopeptide (TPR) repeat protein
VSDVLKHESAITGASFSADGRHVVTETFLPNLVARALLATGESPAGLTKLIQVMRPANTINVWNVSSGKRIATLGPWRDEASLSFRRAAFCPDVRLLLIVSDGEARLWNIAESRIVRRFHKPGAAVVEAAMSPDGRTLATASDDDTVQLWNADTGKLIPTPVHFRHGEQNWPPLFSSDGRFLVLSVRPAGVRVWDATTGTPISPPLSHPGLVQSATFSPDGRLLLTASDRAARAWQLSADDRNADEWLHLAQLLSCARMHSQGGPPVPLSADELRAGWEKLRHKSASAFSVPARDAITWHAEAARTCEKIARWDAALPHLERLIVLDPERLDLFARRGRAYAEAGRWKDAAADFEKASSLASDKYKLWYRHAVVRLQLDERDVYRKVCGEMLDRFESSNNLDAAQLAAWTSSLGPVAQMVADRSVAAADRAVKASPRNHARLLTLGAAHFRARRYDNAVQTLNEAVRVWTKGDNVWDWLYLSMAHHHLGNADLARANLDKAVRWIDQKQVAGADGKRASTLFWSDQLELSLLRKEAEGYLRSAKD